MQHRTILRIKGHVQGVYFRASARDVAVELGLKGFVRNEPDGSVYAEAEGGEEKIRNFVEWCRHGPPRAKVESVEVETAPLTGFKKFEVL